jgi:hypothetical protein
MWSEFIVAFRKQWNAFGQQGRFWKPKASYEK